MSHFRSHARHLSELLSSGADHYPDMPWFEGADALSYAQGYAAARALAEQMIAQGLRAGDRVALCLLNGPSFGVSCHAAWLAGAIVVPLHPAYPDIALMAQLRPIRPTILVGGADATSSERTARIAHALDHCMPLSLDDADLYKASATIDGARPAAASDPQALALLQFTGGTTGAPKAAMLTHANLSINLAQMRAVLGDLVEGGERSLAVAPFAHISGFNAVFNLTTMIGGTLVVPHCFSPQTAAAACRQSRATILVGTPTLLSAIADAPRSQAADSWHLRNVISGGAPLPIDVRERFEAATGATVLQGYGLSETSPAVTLSRSGGGLFGDCGLPVQGTQISAHDPATGEQLPAGEIGEIRVSGPQVMQGYWECEDETRYALVDGKLRTGDLGQIEAGGRLVLRDRLKDLIIASGYNIYPAQVEEAIYQHDAVREAAVIGVPHTYRGETVKAVVALHPGRTLTLEELQAFLRDLLSPMAIPKQFEVLTDLPKSPAGKILRRALQSDEATAAL